MLKKKKINFFFFFIIISFGSVGGYISGSEDFINYLKQTSYGSIHATSMSPACAQMALSTLSVIGTNEGFN